MTEPDHGWWTAATQPKYPHHPSLRALQHSLNRPQTAPPELEPEQSGDIAAVASMDTVAYAAARDSLMAGHGGPKPSSDYQGIEAPIGRAGLVLDHEQMAQLMPWRSIGERPPQGRVIENLSPADQTRAGLGYGAVRPDPARLAVPTNRYTSPEGN